MPIAVFIKWKLFHTHGQKEMLVLVISGFLIEKLDDKDAYTLEGKINEFWGVKGLSLF